VSVTRHCDNPLSVGVKVVAIVITNTKHSYLFMFCYHIVILLTNIYIILLVSIVIDTIMMLNINYYVLSYIVVL
jgi:hypothetical protein